MRSYLRSKGNSQNLWCLSSPDITSLTPMFLQVIGPNSRRLGGFRITMTLPYGWNQSGDITIIHPEVKHHTMYFWQWIGITWERSMFFSCWKVHVNTPIPYGNARLREWEYPRPRRADFERSRYGPVVKWREIDSTISWRVQIGLGDCLIYVNMLIYIYM